MNTFEAISHIRRQSMSRAEAMRYLMENLGFNATYADEIVAVIFRDHFGSETQPEQGQAKSS